MKHQKIQLSISQMVGSGGGAWRVAGVPPKRGETQDCESLTGGRGRGARGRKR